MLTRRTLLGGVAGGLCVRGASSNAIEVGLLLVLLTDMSDSVDDGEFRLLIEGTIRALQSPRVLERIQRLEHRALGLLALDFATRQRIRVDWHCIRTAADMAGFCHLFGSAPRPDSNVREGIGGNTYIGQAITRAVRLLGSAPYRSERRTIDVAGDGVDNGHTLERARKHAIENDIVINGLPALISSDDQPPEGLDVYYKNNVVGGPMGQGFVVPVYDLVDYEAAMTRKLVMEIS